MTNCNTVCVIFLFSIVLATFLQTRVVIIMLSEQNLRRLSLVSQNNSTSSAEGRGRGEKDEVVTMLPVSASSPSSFETSMSLSSNSSSSSDTTMTTTNDSNNGRRRFDLGPIFYNVYVPPHNNTKNAHRIVREQLEQIHQSLVGDLQSSSRNHSLKIKALAGSYANDVDVHDDEDEDDSSWSSVFVKRQNTTKEAESLTRTTNVVYNLIGNKRSSSMIGRICQQYSPRINCTLNKFMKEGNEIDTLQSMWEYCKDNPLEVVTYIHDKGSFNPRKTNTLARRHTTRAALECRNLMMSDDGNDETGIPRPKRCNFCSYRFHVLPGFHTRSNMWSAKCDYIRQLLPPNRYEDSVRQMLNESVLHPTLNKTKYACLSPYNPIKVEKENKTYSELFWGLGRFSAERWALNHPLLKPCDCVSKRQRSFEYKDWTPSLYDAPQSKSKREGIGNYKTSWERLHGRLFEWEWLYGHSSGSSTDHNEDNDSFGNNRFEIFATFSEMMNRLTIRPPKSSWVWKYYKGVETGTDDYLKSCQKLREENEHQTLSIA